MAPFIVFGDAEAAVAEILRTAMTGVTVSTDLAGYNAGDPWIRVARTGGVPTLWMRLDNPVVSLAVYAADKPTAHDMAMSARASVFAQSGIYTGHGLALFDTADGEGIAWNNDVPEMPHYTLSLALVTRPI